MIYTILYIWNDNTARNRKLHKFATANSNLEKSIILDMHHRISYMYINFQQNRGRRPVKTTHTIITAKILNCRNLQPPNNNFEKGIISDLHHR